MFLKTPPRLLSVLWSVAVLATTVIILSPSAQAKPSEAFSAPKVAPSDISVAEGLKYSDSPEYKNELENAVSSARKFCTDYQNQHEDEKNLAVVFDIDETLLDNRPFLRKQTDLNPKAFFEWVAQGDDPQLEPVTLFAEWARANGFAVFLITSRYEDLRRPTIENLVKVGIAYDGLYMAPSGIKEPAEITKTAHRKAIEDMGFKIVENMGDQISDLVGGHSLDCEKLPNKMYFVP